MKEELDEALCKDFPHVFADRRKDMKETAMCWGFPGTGWEPLIREAAAKLEPLIIAEIKKNPEAWDYGYLTTSQIKEKYGTLRWYFTACTDEMQDIIDLAEAKSCVTCETCGKEGKLRGSGWFYTACIEHTEKEDLENLEYLENKYDENQKENQNGTTHN
jgi:hypothetical protein